MRRKNFLLLKKDSPWNSTRLRTIAHSTFTITGHNGMKILWCVHQFMSCLKLEIYQLQSISHNLCYSSFSLFVFINTFLLCLKSLCLSVWVYVHLKMTVLITTKEVNKMIVGGRRVFIMKCWMIKYLLTRKFCLHQKALTNFTYLPIHVFMCINFNLKLFHEEWEKERDTISSLTTTLNAQQKM